MTQVHTENPLNSHHLDVSASALERDLQIVLGHLYDPDYAPSKLLTALTESDLHAGALAVQSSIIHFIEGLEPPANTSASASTRRIYDLLHSRFVVGLTQEDTAEHMHLSVSSVQRIQREAIHALALHIWDATKARQPSLAVAPVETPSLDQSSSDAQNVSWRSQMHRDLASLHDGAASVRANVGDMIHTVITLEQALTSSRGITLVPGAIRASLMVAVHPSVLRQILVMSIGRLVDQIAHGSIRIDAQGNGGQVQLLLTCEPPATVIGVNWGPVCEILATEGSSLEVAEEATCSSVRIELPRAGDVAVLVVDDNSDMLYLYRRCVKRTNYRIIHEHSAQCLFESVQQHAPEVIILDIMLPDVDGWQLLSDLHHHHTTHRIPIIVCSVIGEEDLALALGASLFLHKPVDCRSFIQALDRILRPAPLVAATKPASTAATG